MGKGKIFAIISGVACTLIAAFCVGVFIVRFTQEPAEPIPPDYVAQETEKGQKPLEGDTSEHEADLSGGGTINITYGFDITVSLADEKVYLLYANPGVSNHNVSLLVMIEDLVIAKSELILPGYGVDVLDLDAYAKERLLVGGYDGVLVVRAYHPETGEKAMVDAEGAILVTVVE
jgi:hypothetical protein